MSDPPQPAGDELSFEEFYEHAPSGYLSLSGDGSVVRVNETFLRWSGFSADALLNGRRFVELLSVGSQLYYETHCMPRLLAGHVVDQVALDVRRADGSLLPVLFYAKVHATEAGGAPRIVRVTVVDVSQRREFERQLITLNQRLERSVEDHDAFAYATAHDLRAPLRSIRLGTEFLLDDAGELPAEVNDHLASVLRLSGRMGEMLDDLLAFAQAGAGNWRPERLRLQAAVDEAVELLGARAADALITTADVSLSVDPSALRPLLLNLVGNAVKYCGERPPEIVVDACRLGDAPSRPPLLDGVADDALVLRVADRGVGIDPAQHDRVFALFRQVDPGTEGSGTGLALCRRICRRHGGEIWLESEPGRGSTFYALLAG